MKQQTFVEIHCWPMIISFNISLASNKTRAVEEQLESTLQLPYLDIKVNGSIGLPFVLNPFERFNRHLFGSVISARLKSYLYC